MQISTTTITRHWRKNVYICHQFNLVIFRNLNILSYDRAVNMAVGYSLRLAERFRDRAEPGCTV